MMIDKDYDLLCGVPRLRTIYHGGGWYEVVATDIGRAPQPNPATGDERLDPEPMPPGVPYEPKVTPVRERIRRHLEKRGGTMTLIQLAHVLHISSAQTRRHLDELSDEFEMRELKKRPRGRPTYFVTLRGKA